MNACGASAGRRWFLTRALILCSASLAQAAAAAAGWIAFIAPDFPQSRSLFGELKARAAADLKTRDLELRFVPLPPDLREAIGDPIAAALDGKPMMVIAPAEEIAITARRLSGSRIPIIFSTRSDPVRSGLVKSLSRPGGNVTGISYDVEIERKQLELLRQIAPGARLVGVLADEIWSTENVSPLVAVRYEKEFGLRLRIFSASTPEDAVRLTRTPEAGEVDAWLIPITNHNGRARNEVVAAIRDTNKPAIYGRTFFVDGGGLASYQEVIRQPMAIFHEMMRAILKGKPAGDIPVRRPRDFELALNPSEAERLGIKLPPALLRRADRIASPVPSP